MKKQRITGLLLAPGGAPVQFTVNNTLEDLQSLVGGYLETITLPGGIVILCDEDAWFKSRPFCCAVVTPTGRHVPIRGPIAVLKYKGDRFTSYTEMTLPKEVRQCTT